MSSPYADVELYGLAAALPVLLLTLFALFRWRYLRVVERAIYADMPMSDVDRAASPQNVRGPSLVLVSERGVKGRIEGGPALLTARREEAAYRNALTLSGLLFVTYGFAWLGLTVLLPNFAGEIAWQWSVLPLAAFGLTLPSLLRPLRRRARTRVPRRLLLLRPFNDGRLRSDLLNVLEASWCRTGTLELIVGGARVTSLMTTTGSSTRSLGRTHANQYACRC